jgi:FKBP-type peptidyl-prolyl cis-trans isomerase FklB
MSPRFFTLNLDKGDFLLKALLFLLISVSFTSCEVETPTSICYPTAEQQLAQKAVDIKVISNYLREKNVDTTNIQQTDSGIKYVTLSPGSGPLIKQGDRVEVSYIGKDLNGHIFDSSYDRNETFFVTVGVSQVIKGWTEALQLMHGGEETRFYIPSYIAYGPCGGGSIGPDQQLIFDIKVVSVNK